MSMPSLTWILGAPQPTLASAIWRMSRLVSWATPRSGRNHPTRDVIGPRVKAGIHDVRDRKTDEITDANTEEVLRRLARAWFFEVGIS